MTTGPTKVIGIDLGGTRIKIGLIDDQGKIIFFKNYLTRVELGQEKVIRRIIRFINHFIKTCQQMGTNPRLIGLGSAGIIDREEGIVRTSPNFPDWKEVPLGRFIFEEIGLPTFLDNDANMVTYGEKWIGAGRDMDHFLCLTLGTGVGSGLILNGQPWYGSQGNGPEFGHMTIKPNGVRCGCGNRGCLETLASATYLVKKAQKGLENKIPTKLSEIVSSTKRPLSAKLLYETAQKGDLFCISLFAEMGRYLGMALANGVYMLGVEGVILGGGLSQASTIFLPYLEKEFKKRLTLFSADKVSIRISFLGEKSGILGAAKMAIERSKI